MSRSDYHKLTDTEKRQLEQLLVDAYVENTTASKQLSSFKAKMKRWMPGQDFNLTANVIQKWHTRLPDDLKEQIDTRRAVNLGLSKGQDREKLAQKEAWIAGGVFVTVCHLFLCGLSCPLCPQQRAKTWLTLRARCTRTWTTTTTTRSCR
jgi:hypothetical protein